MLLAFKNHINFKKNVGIKYFHEKRSDQDEILPVYIDPLLTKQYDNEVGSVICVYKLNIEKSII